MVFRPDAFSLRMKPALPRSVRALVGLRPGNGGDDRLPAHLGDKAYWASRRVFHYQFGTWQMAESYHTDIQASGIMTEVQGR